MLMPSSACRTFHLRGRPESLSLLGTWVTDVSLKGAHSMSEQSPHVVEVFSRNKVSRSQISFVAVTIPVLALTGLAVYALLPVVWLLTYGILAVLCLSAMFLGALGVLYVRRRWIHDAIVPLSEFGDYHEDRGELLHRQPLALPAPVQVSEVKDAEPVDRIKQALDILELHTHGSGIRTIAKSYADAGDQYWSEWRVRQLIEGQKKA
jgi:hypothetical protein